MTEPERAAEWSIATGYMVTSPASWASRPMKAYVAAFPSLDAARSQFARCPIGDLNPTQICRSWER